LTAGVDLALVNQTDRFRARLFAAAASFSALLSQPARQFPIRSGMSCATFNVLSPIDPVAPQDHDAFTFHKNRQD